MDDTERIKLWDELHGADCPHLAEIVYLNRIDPAALTELRSLLMAVRFRDAALTIMQESNELLQKLAD